jgi:hypothetical protein
MDDTCVVISGLLTDEYVNNLLITYSSVNNKIITTWENQPQNLIEKLRDNGFIIVLNKPLVIAEYNQHSSALVQTTAIKSGVIKASELGFKYAIRMRSDITCNDFILFCKVIENKYKEKITALCGILNYFYDAVIAGPIEDMLKFYKNTPLDEDIRGPERFLMEEYMEDTNTTVEQFKTKVYFCLEEVRRSGITMYFISKRWEIINDYCRRDFVNL